MPDVFISYSRRNLEFVQQLVTSLNHNGKDPWFDQLKEPLSGIAAGAPWWKQIQDGIENTDNFVFVISPNSISSPYCHAEIHHAREHGKRLVPILYSGWIGESETRKAIDAAIEAIPDADEIPNTVTSSILNLKNLVRANWLAISEIQYVLFSSSHPFDHSLEQLLEALDLDLAWVKLHSQLVQAAKLWEANEFHNDFLWGSYRLRPVYQMIERRNIVLDALVERFIEPEQDRLLRELQTLPATSESHERRRDIGERLAVIGDSRPGVGLKKGIPDVLWLAVKTGGKVRLLNRFTVKPFYISKYQVTYAQYKTFVDAEDGFNNLVWWAEIPRRQQQQKLENQHMKSQNNPRDTISWFQAVAYSRWLDAKLRECGLLPDENLVVRLPTEWEWQWVARGTDERKYPWGKWKEGLTNTRESGLSRPIAVGMYPNGAAECGALDMSGNLYEWCLNNQDPQGVAVNVVSYEWGWKALRGGSYHTTFEHASSLYSSFNTPNSINSGYGFRLVLGVPIASLSSKRE